MSELLVLSNVLLWLAVIALASLVVALLRQIGILHERLAPAGALMGAAGPRVGEPAPELRVRDWAGRALQVGGAAEGPAESSETLVFFVSPTCPVCKTLLPVVRSLPRSEGSDLRLIIASDGPRDEHLQFVAEHGLDSESYVLSSALGRVYEVAKLPYALLIDSQGILRAKGLVNTREHLESLFTARELGVASVQELLAHGRAKGGSASGELPVEEEAQVVSLKRGGEGRGGEGR